VGIAGRDRKRNAVVWRSLLSFARAVERRRSPLFRSWCAVCFAMRDSGLRTGSVPECSEFGAL